MEEQKLTDKDIWGKKFIVQCRYCNSEDIEIEAEDEGNSIGGGYSPSVKLYITCNSCKARVKLPDDFWKEEWKRKGVS